MTVSSSDTGTREDRAIGAPVVVTKAPPFMAASIAVTAAASVAARSSPAVAAVCTTPSPAAASRASTSSW
ncbi:hypothetical protein BE18_09925 [Sorangium cellulosum]|uniref:Uncharacterized protein n=1 Tax=Sorangium cellulosum TaxID=56 RepID=A0A150RGM9_SORCE|nr:hypothetical protein BE18_09925 [Sorangium cellulosum]